MILIRQMTTPAQASRQVSVYTKIAITVVLVGCLVFGVYLTQCGLHSLEVVLDSKSWPATDGVITSSSVKMFVTEIKENGRVVPNKQSRSYSPAIEYQYTVDGLTLKGRRVSIEDASIGTKDSAQMIVDQYPLHKAVTVSYQPEQPANAVLEPGNWLGTYRWFLPGAAFLLIPLLLLLRAIWFYEILRWEPGEMIHTRRARVGFLKSIAGALIAGLVLGLPLGLLPAIFYLSGHGVIFIARFYLAVSALIAVAFTIGLLLYGRRREFLLDWSLGSLFCEIGWSNREFAIENIERLTLKLPARDSQRNPIVDSHSIVIQIDGKTFTLVDTNGADQSWDQARKKLARVITELANALNVPWNETHAPSTKSSRSS